MTTLVVPIKALATAKSRLADSLDQPARRALCMHMLAQVVKAGLGAKAIERIVLISSCPEVSEWATGEGLAVLKDPVERTQSLATIVDHALCQVHTGEMDTLVVMGDLPFVDAQELEGMAAALASAQVILAPDGQRAGTNALGLRAGVHFETCFGRPDSFAAHIERCQVAGLSTRTLTCAGLAFDVDTGSDLQRYLRAVERARDVSC